MRIHDYDRKRVVMQIYTNTAIQVIQRLNEIQHSKILPELPGCSTPPHVHTYIEQKRNLTANDSSPSHAHTRRRPDLVSTYCFTYTLFIRSLMKRCCVNMHTIQDMCDGRDGGGASSLISICRHRIYISSIGSPRYVNEYVLLHWRIDNAYSK